jgi:mono/diheme cytochrome c family protein
MNKKAKFISIIAILGCVSIAVTSCGKKDKNSPGVEFMPDMYRSPSLESNMAYVSTVSGDTLQANMLPVTGSVARGYMPYAYPNTPDGYEAAGVNLRNPLQASETSLKEGEVLYGKYCVHCHGAGGEGDGLVGTKLPGPPPGYSTLKNLPDGKMFHSITYGKGLMGAHAPLVSKDERWKLVLYIRKLQFPNGVQTASTTDSTAVKPK